MQYCIQYSITQYSTCVYHKICSACLAKATNLLCFKISAPLHLASWTCFHSISSASSTEIFLGNTLP